MFNTITIVVLVLYLGVLIYSAIKHKTGGNTSGSKFFMGKGLGNFPLLCAVAMSIFSGLSYYGYPSSIYTEGIGYLSGVGGFVVTFLFCTVGYRLWILGKEYGFTSPGEYLKTRYYDDKYGYFVTILLFIFIIPYVGTQIITIGDGVEITTGGAIPYEVAAIVFTVVIAAHVFLGGMGSVVWMSIFHFVLGYGALVLVFYFVTTENFEGGLFEGLRSAYEIVASGEHASVLSAPGPRGTFSWQGAVNVGLAGAVATIVWPNMFGRCFLAKDKNNFKVMATALPICTAFMFGILGIIGAILAPAILGPNASYADGIMATLSTNYAPGFVSIISLLALCAFAISTIDTFLLVASQLISKDIYSDILIKKGQKEKAEKNAIKVGHIAIIFIVIVMLWVVMVKPASVTENAYKLASPFFGMILPATIGGLYWKRGTREGAWAGTVVGIIVTVIFTFFVTPPFQFSAFVWGLLANTVAYVGVSLVTKAPEEVIEKYITKAAIAEKASKKTA